MRSMLLAPIKTQNMQLIFMIGFVFPSVAVGTDYPCLFPCNITVITDWMFFCSTHSIFSFLLVLFFLCEEMWSWLAVNDKRCSAESYVLNNISKRKMQRATELPLCIVVTASYVLYSTDALTLLTHFIISIVNFLYHFNLFRSDVWYELLWSEHPLPFRHYYMSEQSGSRLSSSFLLDFPDGKI